MKTPGIRSARSHITMMNACFDCNLDEHHVCDMHKVFLTDDVMALDEKMHRIAEWVDEFVTPMRKLVRIVNGAGKH